MKNKYLKVYLASLMLSISCIVNIASAGLIVDNGFNVNATNGAGWYNNTATNWRTWDDFAVANDTIITSASFLMQNSASSYVFEIRSDNTGTFGSSVFSVALSAADVTVTSVGLGFNQFDFDLSSINLLAGTYWASFSGNSGLYGSKVGSFGATMIQQLNNSSNSLRTNNYIPFQLNGTTRDVPEPSTLAIFALGMIGLASRRFKKQS